jgi:hypothetical protein
MTHWYPANETAASFYGRKVVEGRAVVSEWREGEPRIWLTKPLEQANVYCLCFADRPGLRIIEGSMSLASLAIIASKLERDPNNKPFDKRAVDSNQRRRRWRKRIIKLHNGQGKRVESRMPWLEPETSDEPAS